MEDGHPGLRLIKKGMTREAIANAALALTRERGLANVTLEEVARVSFVSPRTVSNYFSCKEEAVVAAGNEFKGLLHQLTHAPDDEPPLQVLRRVVTEFFVRQSPSELEKSRGRLRLIEENPSLRPFQVAAYEKVESEFRSIVAQRSGTDVRTDMYPWLVAAAAMSAARIVMRTWTRSGGDAEQLPSLISSAFDQLDAGLQMPREPQARSLNGTEPTEFGLADTGTE